MEKTIVPAMTPEEMKTRILEMGEKLTEEQKPVALAYMQGMLAAQQLQGQKSA